MIEIKKKLNLPQSIEVLYTGMIVLYLNKTISTKNLALKMKVSVPVASAFKKELVNEGYLKREAFYVMTNKGREFAEEVLNYRHVDTEHYRNILEDQDAMQVFLDEALLPLEKTLAARPNVDVSLDQAHMTLHSIKKRLVLFLSNPLVFNQSFVFIGDDDLMSLALVYTLSALGLRQSRTISVYDIDGHVLDFIRSYNMTPLNVETHYGDVRNEYEGQKNFDIVVTDPPYTIEGIQTFVSFGQACLKEGGRMYLSYSHKTPQFQNAIQKLLVGMKLHFIEVKPSFNTYEGGSIIGNQSNLYILEKTHDVLIETGMYTRDVILTSKPHGYHSLYELNGCDPKLIQNVSSVEVMMKTMVKDFKLNAVMSHFHQFEPIGVSGVVILQESHFTIHTWPEDGYVAIDLFICDDSVSTLQFCRKLKALLKARTGTVQMYYRG